MRGLRLTASSTSGNGAVDLADLVVRASDQKDVIRILEGPGGKTRAELARALALALAEQRVELQEQGVHDLVVGLGEAERLVAHADGLVELAERVDVHLGRVQHRFEVAVVERDGLAVAVDGLLVVALESGDVAEQVVRLG